MHNRKVSDASILAQNKAKSDAGQMTLCYFRCLDCDAATTGRNSDGTCLHCHGSTREIKNELN